MVYEDLHIHPHEATKQALSLSASYKSCLNTPTHGYFKLNVDGVVFSNFQFIGIGFILHNPKCISIMTTSVKESDILNPETIEALAILWGLQQCIHLDLTHLIIESDC